MSHYSSDTNSSDSDLEDFLSKSKTDYRSRPHIIFSNKEVVLEKIEMPELKKEYLDMIPEFNGEKELLPRFIEVCGKLVSKFYNTTDITDFQNEYLMSSILAKIKGKAALNISSCEIKNFAQLKTALLNAYGDKRDCFSLTIEITELKQNINESPFEFYNKIQTILNLQISYIKTHISVEEVPILTGFFKTYALKILLRGLREPLGSLMRTKDPADLNDALGMLTNDFQVDITMPKPKFNNYNNIQNKNRNNFRPITFPQNSTSNFKPNVNSFYPRYNLRQPYDQYFNNGPSTSQQNFSYSRFPNPKFYNQPSTSQQYTPTPMSIGSSRLPYPSTVNRGNFNNKNFKTDRSNVIIEEVHNIEENSRENKNEIPINKISENNFLDQEASEHLE